MKVRTVHSREQYLDTQIRRSRQKFGYCKVSASDPLRYLKIINTHQAEQNLPSVQGPIVCLGTRNGREVDLFRLALVNPVAARIIANTELKIRGFLSPLDRLIGANRSNLSSLNPHAVVGVEINPDAKRKDVWIGSFDSMPSAWSNQFTAVYSNSFDQSQDPSRTATEWMRITKLGGYLIIAFNINKEPTGTDPVGGLHLTDIEQLFPGKLIYFSAAGSIYAEAIIQKTST